MLGKISNICVVVVVQEYYSFELSLGLVVCETFVIFVYTNVLAVRVLQLYNSFLLQSRDLIRSIFVIVEQEFCV